MSWHVRVIANRYADSVRLMGVANTMRRRDGVARGEVVMGTAANLRVLAGMGVDVDAGPGDIVLVVDAEAQPAQATLDEAESALLSPPGADDDGDGARLVVRSLPLAARELEDANVALISVPGEYATLETHQALSSGMHAFVFSDHVSVADEIELKSRGAGLGLLVMGPECGTSMLGGVGLGFANVVRPGPVGIVSAGGTGAQEVACLIDAAGSGVSEIIGVGGRDLSAEVGGIMFREAMSALGDHEGTDTLLLVSKRPAPEVVHRLGEAAPEGVRVVAAFVGWDGADAPFEIHPTLEAGALSAAGAEAPDITDLERAVDERRSLSSGRRLLALYSGGSLAQEAVSLLEPALGPVAGNVSAAGGREGGHTVLDLGDGEYTQGRPHPMVDPTTRVAMLEAAAEDESVGCVLLDVVLGHGAHAFPAGALGPAVERVARGAVVIMRVCGTPDDPQDSRRHTNAFTGAGALIAPSNAAAARLAARALR
jgi:FdrA protein